MAKLMDKVFKNKEAKGKGKGRNWLKLLGITSSVIWVAAMGGVYALKDMSLAPADTHDKDGHDEAVAGAHGPAAEQHAAEDGHEDKDHGKAEAHHGDPAKGAEENKSHAAEAGHGKSDPKNSQAHADDQAEAEVEPSEIQPPATQDERNALRELAEIHASRGDLEKAVYPLRKLMREPTKDVALLSLATEVFLGTGHYKEALAASRKALRHAQPGRVDLVVAKVLAQYRLGHIGEAIKAAETALQEYPKDLSLLTALGTMEIEMGPAHPTYGHSLEKALKIDPKHIPALYQAGRRAQLEGDYKDAETLFRKVIKLDGKHAKAHGQLGTALYNLKQDAEARRAFETALRLNPKDYNTWFNLGESHLASAARESLARRIRDHRKEAMTCYLKAVEWNPDHAEAHYRIGVLLNGNGQFKEAIRHLDAARKVDGSHVPTLLQLAVAYENLKRPERAKGLLEQALKLDPTDRIVQFKLKQST